METILLISLLLLLGAILYVLWDGGRRKLRKEFQAKKPEKSKPAQASAAEKVKAFFSSAKGADSNRQKSLNRELLFFAEHLRRGFSVRRSIDDVMEEYLSVSGPALAPEIRHFLADYRSGSPEQAIFRFSERMKSREFTEICQGLYAEQRGESTSFYWSNLVHQIKERSRYLIKKDNDDQIRRISRQSFVVVISFVAIVLAAVLLETFSKISTLFLY